MMLRGEQVAAILADYRMPRMNGIEFLEEAMDLVPQARRALLTAYADTNAAIAAINVVDVDHYLLKPWEPPEEKLYPVVDELLATWQRDGPAGRAQDQDPRPPLVRRPRTRCATSWPATWCPYRWYNVDEPDGARLLAAAGADATQAPVVITADGEPLIQPSLVELADAVGLSTTPAGRLLRRGDRRRRAGRVWARRCTRRPRACGRWSSSAAAAGGQAGQSSRIENYLGFPDGVAGGQLTDRARRQALRFGAELLTARSVAGLEAKGPAAGGELRRRHRRSAPTPWCWPPG